MPDGVPAWEHLVARVRVRAKEDPGQRELLWFKLEFPDVELSVLVTVNEYLAKLKIVKGIVSDGIEASKHQTKKLTIYRGV